MKPPKEMMPQELTDRIRVTYAVIRDRFKMWNGVREGTSYSRQLLDLMGEAMQSLREMEDELSGRSGTETSTGN